MFHLFKYLKVKDWLILLVCVGLIVAQVGLELKMPDYTKELTTIVQSGTDVMDGVWKNGGLMLACAGGSLLMAIICSILISNVASSFSRNLREQLFNKIADFSNEEMNLFSTPSLITRTTNDVMQMQNFMAMGVQLLFKAPIMAVWAILKISSTNVSWTAAVAICVGVIVVCVSILVKLCLPRFRKIQKLTDELNDVTRENITGVRVVRAFNAEAYQEAKFDKVNNEITNNHLFTSRVMGLLNPVMNICMNALILAIYWIGAVLINNIVMSDYTNPMEFIGDRVSVVGNMAAFSQYAMQVVMSFMMLILIFIILPRTMVSGNRIYEVLKTVPSIVSGTFNGKTDKCGTVEFKNVSFAYGDEAENAVEDLNFTVDKGETLAIIGSTGCGKTTIVNLISRFYDVTKGEILVDGINVKEYKEEDLRNKISVAAQKAALFKGSIKDNVAYGCENPDENKIKKALEIAKADFVNELDNGIESEVAQGGTNFSGGQKQRISIARALYKDAKIVIFDDTFSALDYKTDMLVRKGIKENLTDTTVIIVAQRIGTIMHADKIMVLDEGRIVGMGTHKELLESCDTYKEIALSQLSEEEI
ncbi:MAG: ABC transporter ATP-binding protein [Lachnospira sp.]|nr:ABC transporter ATP-binding protein [Lachnospira sp.]